MVTEVVSAEEWHSVAMVRRAMLLHSFSTLPIKSDGQWKLVTDHAIAQYLQGVTVKKERDARLASQLAQLIPGTIELQPPCVICGKEELVTNIVDKVKQVPLLVVENGNLVGLLSAFDLL